MIWKTDSLFVWNSPQAGWLEGVFAADYYSCVGPVYIKGYLNYLWAAFVYCQESRSSLFQTDIKIYPKINLKKKNVVAVILNIFQKDAFVPLLFLRWKDKCECCLFILHEMPAGSPVLEADVRLWQNEDHCLLWSFQHCFIPISKLRTSWEGEMGLIWIWMIFPTLGGCRAPFHCWFIGLFKGQDVKQTLLLNCCLISVHLQLLIQDRVAQAAS